MIRVPIAEQQVQPQAIQGTSDEFRRMDLSDAFGAVGADFLIDGSEVVGEMAKREDEMLRQETEVQMATDLAAFDVENEARVTEIAQQSPGRGLTQRVMDDFNERKQAVVDAQPNYLKPTAQTKLLPLQVRQAKSAIGVENAQIQQQTNARFSTFKDAQLASAVFGRVGLEDSLASNQEYASKLPAHMRENALRELNEISHRGHLANRMEANPEQTVQDIKDGKYDGLVSTTKLIDIYEAGNKALAKKRTDTDKTLKKVRDLRVKDSAQAGALLLQAQGVESPSIDEVMEIQTRPVAEGGLGLPRAYQTTKAEAEEFTFQIKNQKTAEDSVSLIKEYAQQLAMGGRDPSTAMREIAELTDEEPVFKMVFSTDFNAASPEFLGAWYDVTRDPKAVEQAEETFARFGLDRDDKADILETAVERAASAQTILSMAGDAGVDMETQAAQSKAVEDVATVMAARMLTANMSKSKTKAAVKEQMENTSIVTPVIRESSFFRDRGLGEIFDYKRGTDAYYMPKDLADTITPERMEDAKIHIIETGVFEPVGTYLSEEDQITDYRQNASWVMLGNDEIALKAHGETLKHKDTGEPISVRFSELYKAASDGKVKANELAAAIQFAPLTREIQDIQQRVRKLSE